MNSSYYWGPIYQFFPLTFHVLFKISLITPVQRYFPIFPFRSSVFYGSSKITFLHLRSRNQGLVFFHWFSINVLHLLNHSFPIELQHVFVQIRLSFVWVNFWNLYLFSGLSVLLSLPYWLYGDSTICTVLFFFP